jgi:hypothetical protein
MARPKGQGSRSLETITSLLPTKQPANSTSRLQTSATFQSVILCLQALPRSFYFLSKSTGYGVVRSSPIDSTRRLSNGKMPSTIPGELFKLAVYYPRQNWGIVAERDRVRSKERSSMSRKYYGRRLYIEKRLTYLLNLTGEREGSLKQ